MSVIQQCKQCGEIQSISMFREYYGKLKGHYKVCKACERINQRWKYLNKKASPSTEDVQELKAIEELYVVQRKMGLKPPKRRNADSEGVADIIGSQLERLKERAKHIEELSEEMPEEIAAMMTSNFEPEVPEVLQEKLDKLWEKYRPIIRLDENNAPVYDERYTEHLNKLQTRLDDYEDEFYSN